MARKVVGTTLGPVAGGANFVAALAFPNGNARLFLLNTAGGAVATFGGPMLVEFRDGSANVLCTVLGNVVDVPIPSTAIDVRITNTHPSVAIALLCFDVILEG